MKDINEQIKFIDTKLLPLFGLKNIIDYNNFIKCELDKKEEEQFIININNLLSEIKSIFPVKRFNLHKTDDKIKSYKQAINILKMCLEIANINYVIDKFNDNKIVRLNTTNLFLYRYIEKMDFSNKNTDLRQTENILSNCDKKVHENIKEYTPIEIINKHLTPGTKESHKTYNTYTNDDLRNQIKTTNNTQIQLRLRHFIQNDGAKIFKLPLNLTQINNIHSIKIAENELCDLKKAKVLDKYYILSNRYGYLIDGDFKFNKNLIPNNIIIPLNLSLYTDLSLYIPINMKYYHESPDAMYQVICNLYFDIELGETIFYKPFQEKLLNEKDCFLSQTFDNKTLLYDFNQQNFSIQKDDKLYEIKREENDSIIVIENAEYKINKIKNGNLDGYETPYTANIEKPNLLHILFHKHCNFVKTTLDFNLNMSKFDKYTNTRIFTEKISNDKYKHVLEILFVRYFDSISNILIAPKYGINILDLTKLKVICRFEKLKDTNNDDNIVLTIKEKDIQDKKGFIPVVCFEELEDKHLNLINNYGVTLRFTYETNKITNILEHIYFGYDVYVYETSIRRNIGKLENLFDPLKLYKTSDQPILHKICPKLQEL